MLTERLEVRLPIDDDRSRFVELFGDPDFMQFSGGVLDTSAASDRFDQMLVNAADLPFAKQPIIDRSTGVIVGYTGVAWFEFDGERRLEFGWRLVETCRGQGVATEAARAVLAVADEHRSGEILAMIDPTNGPSKRVAEKLGFSFWKQAVVDGYLDDIHRRSPLPVSGGA